jgi:hypothetical protein
MRYFECNMLDFLHDLKSQTWSQGGLECQLLCTLNRRSVLKSYFVLQVLFTRENVTEN